MGDAFLIQNIKGIEQKILYNPESFTLLHTAAAGHNSPATVQVSTNGEFIFSVNLANGTFYRHPLSTPYMLNTKGAINQTRSMTNTGLITGYRFKFDGTKLFTILYSVDQIQEWLLSTPWDLNSATSNGTISVSGMNGSLEGIDFSLNGSKMLLSTSGTTSGNQSLREYNLTTPWSISNASIANTINMTNLSQTHREIVFINDGKVMFSAQNTNSNNIAIYDFATPYVISSAIFRKFITVNAAQISGISHIKNYVYTAAESGQVISQFQLGVL